MIVCGTAGDGRAVLGAQGGVGQQGADHGEVAGVDEVAVTTEKGPDLVPVTERHDRSG